MTVAVLSLPHHPIFFFIMFWNINIFTIALVASAIMVQAAPSPDTGIYERQDAVATPTPTPILGNFSITG